MLIIPIAGRFDWRHPPWATVLLILVNCLLFASTASKDNEAYEQASAIYAQAELLQYEKQLFREYADNPDWLDDRNLIAVPTADREVSMYIIFDRGFDNVVRDAYATSDRPSFEVSQWKEDRGRFEAAINESTTARYGLVPAEKSPLTFLTNMFLHGGVGHLVGNMVFLFLFGFALERVLGSATYFITYIVTGLGGGLLHVLVNDGSYIPVIGASGAVSGLMGTYLAVYQLRKIKFFYNFLFYFGTFTAPALLVLPAWIGLELYGYYFADTNVAYWDHIGGLVSGAIAGGLLFMLNRVKDIAYLDDSMEFNPRTETLAETRAAVDDFQFDKARSLAYAWVRENPQDAEFWVILGTLMKGRRDDPTYDTYAKGLFQLVQHPIDAAYVGDLRKIVIEAYREYMKVKGPKPALQSVPIVAALGRRFLADGHILEARQLAGLLLKSTTKNADAGLLIKGLSTHFAREGENETASKYMRAYKEKFAEP